MSTVPVEYQDDFLDGFNKQTFNNPNSEKKEKTGKVETLIQKNLSSLEVEKQEPEKHDIEKVVEICKLEAIILEQKKSTTFNINVPLKPAQSILVGKKVGDVFKLPGIKLSYQITRIFLQD